MSQEFDVVCLGGGVAGEAIAVGLQDSGLTLAVVERELVGGECPYWGCIRGLGGFTHLAYYHGQVVARRLRGMDARADHTAVPRVTFTDPEVASVGLSEAAAREKGIDVVVASADPAETARGYIHDFHGGALKLAGDRNRGVLIGATLVTPRAGEVLGELVVAIKLGTPLPTLADVIHPFPAFNRVLGASLAELAAKVA